MTTSVPTARRTAPPRAGTAIAFRVLGPLEAARDGAGVHLGSARERALLATLLLRARRLVTVDELVETVWGHRPPALPRQSVHMCVHRLRRTIGCGHDIIRTSAGGYLADPPRLDLDDFTAAVAAADRAAARRDLDSESAHLRTALSLWRGPILANVRSETLHRDIVPSLEEHRLLVLRRRIDTDLALGRARHLVAELRRLTAENPLAEPFWVQLMLALHGSGHQAAALTAYQAARRHLADELGIDPGTDLRRVHASILTGEAPTAPPPRAGGAPGRDAPPAFLSEA